MDRENFVEAQNRPKTVQRNRRTLIFFGILIAALVLIFILLAVYIPKYYPDVDPDTIPIAARDIMKLYPLIDGHNDLPWQYRQYSKNKVYSVNLRQDTRVQWNEQVNMTDNSFPRLPPQTDIPRLKEGHVGGQFWALFGSCSSTGKDAVRIGFDQLDVVMKFVEKYSDTFEFVTTAQGILDAYLKRNKIASLIGLEGGHMISNKLSVLRDYYRLGVRYMTLTHSCDTSWADNWKVDNNANGSRRGLSEFGEIVVKEMNRLGMMIDLSHVSYDTMRDAIKVSTAPVIFSHSSAYAMCNHNRNVQDDILQLVKENNGLVMVNFHDEYISKGCLPINRANGSTIEDVIDHINHIKNVTGIDHVGIGADYDGVETLPVGLEDVSKYPDLVIGLIAQGWLPSEIKKLIGENLIRVFKAVETRKTELSGIPPFEDLIPEDEVIPENNTCYTSF